MQADAPTTGKKVLSEWESAGSLAEGEGGRRRQKLPRVTTSMTVAVFGELGAVGLYGLHACPSSEHRVRNQTEGKPAAPISE